MADSQGRLAGFEEFEKPQPPEAAEPAAEREQAPLPVDAQGQVTSLEGRTVYVIDSHSLIYQVFHALPPMSSPSGQPVGAVNGFTRDVLDLLENHKPDFLICAFDHSDDTFRHEFYPEYKGTRDPMPDDLRPQIGEIRKLLMAMDVAILDLPRYEADDLLATIADRTEKLGGTCVVVSSDKDCRQLISDRVKIYNIRKNQFYDADALLKDWGVRPDQVVDFQALVGDSVDNVPGIALIGPKIAKELLEKYDTLDGVLDHASEVSGAKRRENLMNGRQAAEMSRRLVELDRNAPIEIDWEACRIRPFDRKQALDLCQTHGFRRLGERIGALNFATTVEPPTVEWTTDYQTVTSLEQLQSLVQEMQQQKHVAIDTETTSPMPRWAEIVGYSFAWKPGQAYYAPVRAPQGDPQLDPEGALEILRPFFENDQVAKIGQNLKYEMIVLRNVGVELRGVAFDTMVADYLLDAGQRNHNLDDLAMRRLNYKTTKISELIGTGKKQKKMNEVPVELITPYASQDADVPLRLFPLLHSELAADDLASLYDDLEIPLITVLAELEFNGIRVDVDLLGELSKKHGKRLLELEKEIYEMAGRKFNIDSPKQLGELLFQELGLPVLKKTKTGPSTDVDTLQQLAIQHPLPAQVIAYRQSAKLKSTYVDALPLLVHPETGRVHTSFMQDVAATGRLSSKDPNLQNIPVRTEEGREIRSAFIPGTPGWSLVAADYSQIELRVLAHFSGDAAMLEAFANAEDIHTRVAAEVYETPPDEVTSDMRRAAKAINFGIIYGQTAFGLAKSLGIDKGLAADFIDAYFARYPGVEEFLEKVLADARKKGYVTTILGRRRLVEGIRAANQRNARNRTFPERIAINTVIQGSAADLIKLAMIQVYRRLKESGMQARMLLQIHDELVFEAPPEEIASLCEMVRTEMTSVGELRTALCVDIKTGANWSACEPWLP
ncbi:DNA polymerase I [Lignipirellula cremea]|uniref:DNA polymerase I n=1 Tax=Lignipirellula cremea TaxID=2528010 RepID=A0A518DSG9_9BACT|nr:DNA polymerase I [Lignipirellula cremea]QDU94785.1 DNA polymerase I [Lignipirellula cremea]